MENNNVPAEGVKVAGQDKRSRLAMVTHLIKHGKIRFPKKGAEELLMQLTGFGIEKHDDLADAFSLLIIKILEDDRGDPGVYIIDMGGSMYDRYSPLGSLDDDRFTLDKIF